MEGIELLLKNKSDCLNRSDLPPIYSVFIKTYATGRDGFRVNYFKYNEDLIQLTSITFFGDDGYENSISHFFNVSEIESELKAYADQIEDCHKQGFIRIGLFDINDSILLGITEDTKDTIWKLNGDWSGNRPYKVRLSDSIFEFINNLKAVVIKMNLLVRKIDENQLYKNWGEDFWRVQEDHTA